MTIGTTDDGTGTPRGSTRARSGPRLMAAGLVAVATSVAVWLAPGVQAAPDSRIQVTTAAAPGPGGCLPTFPAASASISDTESAFVVTVTAWAPVCDTATAVIYSMPADRSHPWPQTKVEATDVRIGPGVTTIRFAKTCQPSQFDVVVGATPDVIDPATGSMHGPLLFAFPWTGFQDFAERPACSGVTTTTASTTTTTGATTTSSTTTSSTSTTAATTTTTATTVPVTVAGVTVTTAPTRVEAATLSPTSGGSSGATAPARALAVTGTAIGAVFAFGLVLVAAGMVVEVTGRRRR